MQLCEQGPDDNHSRSQFWPSSHSSDHATRSTTPFVETTEFLDIEELISDQGDIAIIIEEHPDTPGQYFISAYQPLQSDSPTEQDISNSYLSACDLPDSPNPPLANSSSDSTLTAPSFDTPIYTLRPSDSTTNQSEAQASTFVTRKYKPVAKKVRAVLADLPDKYRTCWSGPLLRMAGYSSLVCR